MSHDKTLLLLHITFIQLATIILYSVKSCCYVRDTFNMHSKASGSHRKMEIMLGNFTFMLFKHTIPGKRSLNLKGNKNFFNFFQFFYGHNIAICPQVSKKCTILGNLRIITQERTKEIRQMTPFFHLLFEL